MKRTVGLAIALVVLVWARSTTQVPIFTFWWWLWIIATCVIAWLGGWVHRTAYDSRKRYGSNKTTAS